MTNSVVVESENGVAQVGLDDAANVLVTGFAGPPAITDLTTGLRRTGSVLETDAGTAIYLGLPAGASVLVVGE